MKKIINVFLTVCACVFLVMCFGDNVKASYDDTCVGGEIETNSLNYKKCNNGIIYLLPGNEHSSYIISIEDADRNKQILYAGKQNGVETFYTTRFNLYSVVYDDRGLFSSDENYWMDLSINGVVKYSGEFNDNILVDESEKMFTIYSEVGTYLLRQYYKDEIVGVIRVVVVNRLDVDLMIDSAYYGNAVLDGGEIVKSTGNLVFNVNGGKYGFESVVNVSVNSCNIEVAFSKKIVVSHESFASCLIDNDDNKVSVTLTNGLSMKKTFTYEFKLVGESVSIKLENNISTLATSSRRIVIKASAGKDSELNTDYSLYYWSKNPNDGLNYSDFMVNYEKSENKGTYNSTSGVILRNEEGTYYLYALAKDGNSEIVVRSDEYILTKKRGVNRVSKSNVIFVAIMVVIAALPIFVYLLIREKDTV